MSIVLISGGSRGLGAGLVQAFLERGDTVASFSRSRSKQVETWQCDYPDRFLFRELDMTDRQASAEFVQTVQASFGDIEVLVNNAGMAYTSLLALANDEDTDQVLDLNLRATIHLTRLVSRPMLTLERAAIINITSIVGLSGYRGLSVYSASKAALDGFTRSLARELGSNNIRVNSVAPGYLATEMTDEMDDRELQQIIRRTPLGRLGDPSDVAEVVCFLASNAARFVTGQVVVVDGGISC